jgi:ABC-type uncharacterized transport system auxiliary subunit
MRLSYAATAVLLLTTGCLTGGAYVPIQQYQLQPEPTARTMKSIGMSLGVRPLDAERPYGAGMRYLEPDLELGAYPNAEWAQEPKRAVTQTLTQALRASERFSDVGDARDMARPDFIVTGTLTRFHEDRTGEGPAAVCEFSFSLRRALGRGVWNGTVTARQPLDAQTPPALAKAMNAAIAEAASEAAEIIAKEARPAQDKTRTGRERAETRTP